MLRLFRLMFIIVLVMWVGGRRLWFGTDWVRRIRCRWILLCGLWFVFSLMLCCLVTLIAGVRLVRVWLSVGLRLNLKRLSLRLVVTFVILVCRLCRLIGLIVRVLLSSGVLLRFLRVGLLVRLCVRVECVLACACGLGLECGAKCCELSWCVDTALGVVALPVGDLVMGYCCV